MDGDAYDRSKFLAEERERAWASERDTLERSSPIRFSLGDMRGAFDAGWDYGVIVMEREMSARVSNLEGKLARAYADLNMAQHHSAKLEVAVLRHQRVVLYAWSLLRSAENFQGCDDHHDEMLKCLSDALDELDGKCERIEATE